MKYALIIGNNRYIDPKLAQLKTPAADSQALANVLGDKSIGNFDEVTPSINQTEGKVSRAISAFLASKKPDDLVLIYFSGHGVLDDRGRLFLALKDTQTSLLKSTGIPSSFIADEMDSCRSKRQILILDCCHSGAFDRGTKGGEQKVVTETTFEGNGFGRVVLAASDSTQYALEGNQVIKQTELSLFTHFLLEGLQTGKADVNNDGFISLDEWYDYTYTHVLSTTPKQVPHKWSYHQRGDLIIAKNPRYELMKREAAEKVAREEAERLRQEKERIEREVAERIAWEKAEREAAEKAVREEIERKAIEKAGREEEQKSTRRAAFASLFSNAIPFTKIVIFVGIILGFFLIGSWAISKFSPSIPVADSTATSISLSESPSLSASPTSKVLNSLMPSPTLTPYITSTPAMVDERAFKIEHLETITIENLSKLSQIDLFTYDGNFLALSPSGKIMLTDAGFIYDLEVQQSICDVSQSKLDQQQGAEVALSDKYAIISVDSTIQVWDLQECTSKIINVPSIRSVVDIAIAPNDVNVLVQAINDEWRHVLVDWNLEQSEQTKRVTLGSAMSDITFAADGVTFAVSTGGGFAQIYRFSDFASGSKFAASNLWANIISYRPDKDILITSDEYPTTNTNIRVWKISTGKSIYKISDATDFSNGRLGISPDGKMYVASKEKALAFWDMDTEAEFHKLDLEKLVFGSIFSDNQKVLLVLLDGNRMAIYGINPDLNSDS